MAQTSPSGTFTVGRDCTVVCIAQNGQRVDLVGEIEFNWTPQYHKVVSKPLNGPPIERYLPDGHRLRFSVDRRSNQNEVLFSQIEAGWWNFGSADSGTSANGSVYVYVTETTGAVTTMQFSGVSLGLTAGGDFKADQPVKQTIEGFAQRYQVV